MPQHPREHVVWKQADVVGEHAEDQPVDEVRDPRRVVPALAQRLSNRRERRRHALGERLPGLPRPQPTGIRERPLQPVACRRVGQVVQLELVRPADAVRPVGADPEPHHVGHDQQRRVLQRQRVLPELVERRVEVRALTLVLPGEVVALPDIGPAVAAGVLPRAPLEAVPLARRVRIGRRRLVQQMAQVDEVLLRCRALLQRRGPPLRDEGVGSHGGYASTTSLSCFAIRALTTCLAGKRRILSIGSASLFHGVAASGASTPAQEFLPRCAVRPLPVGPFR